MMWSRWRLPSALIVAVLVAAAAAGQQAPRPLLPDSVRFAVIGDMGTGGTAQHEVARQLERQRAVFPFTFVITVGDNIYGSQNLVKKFEEPYKALLGAKVDFYASLGNHDNQNQRFYKAFNMDGRRYYTFRKGPVAFFALDSTYLDREQLVWLEKELAQSNADWKIAYFHHPLYSTGRTHGSAVDLRKVLEPLFVRHGVRVVFSGHEHFYERIAPQQGIHYFISGSAGQLRRGDIIRKEPMAAGFDADQAFMLIEVADRQLFYRAISRTGTTVDEGVIARP